MYYTYKNTKVFYKIEGKSKQKLLFLHGWGCDGTIFDDLVFNLKNQYQCLVIDFPPFGKSETLKEVFSLEDYCKIVKNILNENNFQNIAIIAHSFGGRVAIKLASCYNIAKQIILTGSAGLAKKSVFTKLKIFFYKCFKKFLRQENYGSSDYKKLSPIMKQTFVKIVNYDQTQDCKKMECQVLLIFGKKDKETTIKQAKKFFKLIKNSKLIIYDSCGHFCFLENKEKFFDDVTIFLNEGVT